MLEQAIVDAQALREAALKNAEQALIEKFAPQIKEAVESLLEEDRKTPTKRKVTYEGNIYSLMELEDGKATIVKEGEKPFIVSEAEISDATLLQEEEADMNNQNVENAEEEIMAPFAYQDNESEVVFELEIDELSKEIDFGAVDGRSSEPKETYDNVAADLDTGAETDAPAADPLAGLELQESINENEEDLVKEIMDIMNEMNEEEDLLEEELIVDMAHEKDGTFQTHKETLEYYEEMQHAKEAAEGLAAEKEEENKDLKKDNEKLKETIKRFKHKNKQYKDVVEKLSRKVNETLLSNAKLLYSNKTLSDASLNERQKTKIVEAIAKAKTPKEAKSLCEALNATVTSGRDNKSPRTLSESVQRKSNLSGILPRRKQVDESEEHTFADHMKKLAGIK